MSNLTLKIYFFIEIEVVFYYEKNLVYLKCPKKGTSDFQRKSEVGSIFFSKKNFLQFKKKSVLSFFRKKFSDFSKKCNISFFWKKYFSVFSRKSEVFFFRRKIAYLRSLNKSEKSFFRKKSIRKISLENLRYIFLNLSNKIYFSGSKKNTVEVCFRRDNLRYSRSNCSSDIITRTVWLLANATKLNNVADCLVELLYFRSTEFSDQPRSCKSYSQE